MGLIEEVIIEGYPFVLRKLPYTSSEYGVFSDVVVIMARCNTVIKYEDYEAVNGKLSEEMEKFAAKQNDKSTGDAIRELKSMINAKGETDYRFIDNWVVGIYDVGYKSITGRILR